MSSNYQHFSIKQSSFTTWTIENFSDIQEDKIRSSVFHLNGNKFQLFLYPKAPLESFTNDVLIYLISRCPDERTKQPQLAYHFEVSILNCNNKKCYSKEFVWNCKDGANIQRNLTNFIARDYLLNPVNGLMVGGKLTLHCEVNLLHENEAKIMNNSSPKLEKLLENYQALLETGDLSDFTLVVKTKKFSVHKAILGAQSAVFKAMFSNDLRETRENRVQLKDMSIEVCEQLLCHIYSGKIPSLDEHTSDLFIAADRYQLEYLKFACQEMLCSSVTIESVSSILVLADMHSGTQLRKGCIDFIANNSAKVMATEGWKAIEARPQLVLEILKNISRKTQSFFESNMDID